MKDWTSTLRGIRDFRRHPEWRDGFSGPFNGQMFRQELFKRLVQVAEITAIVETGTYRGTTTDFMNRATDLRVFTVESDPECYGYALRRFARRRRIRVYRDDSRTFLRRLARRARLAGRVFFYLDAHWNDDLPLREEVEIVFGSWPDAVVMIDDFRVPSDDGYGWDDYGENGALDAEYLRPLQPLGIRSFYPSTPSAEETGRRRGCVVLAKAPPVVQVLESLDLLRPECPR